jgi:phosphoglycerate-specific signal transduction histidine kinase
MVSSAPPNQVAQRQLVLIAKVLQNLANMSTGVGKEEFMHNFDDFMNRNVPKIKVLYKSLLDTSALYNEKMQMDIAVPEEVRKNSLAAMYTHIYRNAEKIRKVLGSLPDNDNASGMVQSLDALIDMYGEPPNRDKQGNGDAL